MQYCQTRSVQPDRGLAGRQQSRLDVPPDDSRDPCSGARPERLTLWLCHAHPAKSANAFRVAAQRSDARILSRGRLAYGLAGETLSAYDKYLRFSACFATLSCLKPTIPVPLATSSRALRRRQRYDKPLKLYGYCRAGKRMPIAANPFAP